jgi:hypothetical protein
VIHIGKDGCAQMEYGGGTNEYKEEMERLNRMSPTQRLSYIFNLVTFFKQTHRHETDATEELISRILSVTMRYK